MVLDAIDEYLDPLTEHLVITNISCSETRYVEQLQPDKICEIK